MFKILLHLDSQTHLKNQLISSTFRQYVCPSSYISYFSRRRRALPELGVPGGKVGRRTVPPARAAKFCLL
jgi:hypothetical protein